MSVEIQIPGLVQVTDFIDPLIAEIISGGMKGQCMITFMKGQCMITFMRVNSKQIFTPKLILIGNQVLGATIYSIIRPLKHR